MSPIPERAKLHLAMVVFQTGYAGNHVIMRYALNLGVSKLVFPLYRNIIAFSVLAPSAFFLEKKERPAMNTSFLIQFFLLGLIGITLNQGFYIFGLDNTSPAFASATENAVPAVSFLMAALLGIEKVEIKRKDGIAKVVGTILSVAGSLAITLYKGPTIYEPSLRLINQTIKAEEAEEVQNKNWTLGCLCLMGHCLCWSSWIVLQSPLLKKYPARFSFVSYSCFFSVFQFFGISAYFERDLESWKIRSGGEWYALLYTVSVCLFESNSNGNGNLKTAPNDQSFLTILDDIKSSKSPAVINYGASWCGVCSQILPAFQELSKSFSKLKFVYADIDECPETTRHIRYTPTFQFYRDGEKVDEMFGAGEERLHDRLWLHS